MDPMQAYETDVTPREDIGAASGYKTEDDRMSDRLEEMRQAGEDDFAALAQLGDPGVSTVTSRMRQAFAAMDRVAEVFEQNSRSINGQAAYDGEMKARAIADQRGRAMAAYEKAEKDAAGALAVLEMELRAGASVEHGLSGADFGNRMQILAYRLPASLSGSQRFEKAVELAGTREFAEILGSKDGRLALGLPAGQQEAVENVARQTLARDGSAAQQKAAARLASLDNAKRAYAQAYAVARGRALKARLI